MFLGTNKFKSFALCRIGATHQTWYAAYYRLHAHVHDWKRF